MLLGVYGESSGKNQTQETDVSEQSSLNGEAPVNANNCTLSKARLERKCGFCCFSKMLSRGWSGGFWVKLLIRWAK